MIAVILAAGKGLRLSGTGNGRPKCLIEIGGQSILAHQLYALERNGVEKFHIVVGHESELVVREAERLVGDRVSFTFNPVYDTTNTSYSLWLALKNIRESMYYLNGDVLFSQDVIARLRVSQHSSCLALDSKVCGEEEVKVLLDEEMVTQISKQVPSEFAAGEFLGVAKFDSALVNDLYLALDKVVQGDRDRMAYFEKGLELVLGSHFVGIADISDLPTVEIDFPEDLRYARQTVLPRIQQLEAVTG